MYKKIITLIVCIVAIIFISPYMIKSQQTEHFHWNPLQVGKSHSDCYRLGPKKCLDYANCGLCLKNGEVTCIPGDENGAFFKEDCMGWLNTNIYDNHIFNNDKVLRGYPPWNMFYPTYEARYPSPTTMAALL